MMNSLVHDFLDFSQIKAGKFRKNITKFDIRQTVNKVILIQKLKAKDHDIYLRANFENLSD